MSAQPKVILARGTDPFVKALLPIAPCLSTDLDPLGTLDLGDIHIEHRPLGYFVQQGLLHDYFDKGEGGCKIGLPGEITEGKANGGYPLDTSLQGCAHRARIEHIDGRIRPMVYPAHTEVRATVQKFPQGQFYTVRRGAAATVFMGRAMDAV